MGVVNPVLPTPGEPRGTEETDVRNALLALLAEFNGNIEASNLATSVRDLFLPVATVVATARATANDGWLLCDGAAVSRASYAALFTAIGVVYGPGDGLSTFNLPDLRGRAPIGAGTAAGVTGAAAHTIGEKGGSETLTVAELPAHGHPWVPGTGPLGYPYHNVVGSYSQPGGTGIAFHSGGVGLTGGSAPGSKLQPYQAVNFQIKT